MVTLRQRLEANARAIRDLLARRQNGGLPFRPLGKYEFYLTPYLYTWLLNRCRALELKLWYFSGDRYPRLALMFAALARQRRLRHLRAPRRWRRRPAWAGRDVHGAWRTQIRQMLEDDPEVFFEYFRMTPEVFNELLARVAPLIQKRPQYMYIPPGERLALTLQ